jgi:hypothetical protein
MKNRRRENYGKHNNSLFDHHFSTLTIPQEDISRINTSYHTKSMSTSNSK